MSSFFSLNRIDMFIKALFIVVDIGHSSVDIGRAHMHCQPLLCRGWIYWTGVGITVVLQLVVS